MSVEDIRNWEMDFRPQKTSGGSTFAAEVYVHDECSTIVARIETMPDSAVATAIARMFSRSPDLLTACEDAAKNAVPEIIKGRGLTYLITPQLYWRMLSAINGARPVRGDNNA